MSKTKTIKDLIIKTEKIDWQSIKDLQPLSLKNDYNSGKLRESIINNGFTRAIYVWDSGKDIFCVDGHLRMDILKELVADDIKIPEKLNCTFLDLKSRKHAVKVLLEVFNTKTNPINKGALNDWCEFEDLSFDDDFDITFDDLHLDFDKEEKKEPVPGSMNTMTITFDNAEDLQEAETGLVEVLSDYGAKWRIK